MPAHETLMNSEPKGTGGWAACCRLPRQTDPVGKCWLSPSPGPDPHPSLRYKRVLGVPKGALAPHHLLPGRRCPGHMARAGYTVGPIGLCPEGPVADSCPPPPPGPQTSAHPTPSSPSSRASPPSSTTSTFARPTRGRYVLCPGGRHAAEPAPAPEAGRACARLPPTPQPPLPVAP